MKLLRIPLQILNNSPIPSSYNFNASIRRPFISNSMAFVSNDTALIIKSNFLFSKHFYKSKNKNVNKIIINLCENVTLMKMNQVRIIFYLIRVEKRKNFTFCYEYLEITTVCLYFERRILVHVQKSADFGGVQTSSTCYVSIV